MKSVVAKLLTWWIPIKKYRKALRGILNIGVRKYTKIIKTDKNHKFDHELAICAIMKDEGPYLKEWLDYHMLVGVNKFYLYDNESSDDTVDVLKPYIDKGIVEYTFFPGIARQQPAYIDCVTKYKNDVRWLALIDLDEFIVPVQHKKITDFLKTLPLFGQLIVSWVVYGSSGHIKKPKGFVIENFKYHANKTWGVKSIINPRLVINITNPHVNEVAGWTIDENGKKLGYIDQTNNPPTYNKIRINHYITKSYEEMMKRCAKGDACYEKYEESPKFKAQQLFNISDKNDVYDGIMDKYVKKLYQRNKK